MTRKEYQLVASVLAYRTAKATHVAGDRAVNTIERVMASGEIIAIVKIAEAFACQFAHSNPDFDSDRFIWACMEQGKDI